MVYFEAYYKKMDAWVPNKSQDDMLVKKNLINNSYSSNKIVVPNGSGDLFFFEEKYNKNFFLRLLVSYDKTSDDLNGCKHLVDSKKKIMVMNKKSKDTNQQACPNCEKEDNKSAGIIRNIKKKNILKDEKNNDKIEKGFSDTNNIKLYTQNTKKTVDIAKAIVMPNVKEVYTKPCYNFLNEKKKYFSEKMHILNSIKKYTWSELYKNDKTKHIHILWKQRIWREWNYYISMIKIKDDIQDMYYFNDKLKSGYSYDKIKTKLKRKLNSKKYILLQDWEKFLEIHLKEWETYNNKK
ncbi:exported protein, unknown function [Hepatocystis sp. ex Piliocolobus tephrosceles]|nr:exported protein, unknown function [Hepatocystis sp. ex Piliocolobus tephrosceles]